MSASSDGGAASEALQEEAAALAASFLRAEPSGAGTELGAEDEGSSHASGPLAPGSPAQGEVLQLVAAPPPLALPPGGAAGRAEASSGPDAAASERSHILPPGSARAGSLAAWESGGLPGTSTGAASSSTGTVQPANHPPGSPARLERCGIIVLPFAGLRVPVPCCLVACMAAGAAWVGAPG